MGRSKQTRMETHSSRDATVVAYVRANFGKKAADAYADRAKRVSRLKSRKRLRSRRAG